MKITKSYLEKLIREQVESAMDERNGKYATPTSSASLASQMPKSPGQAEVFARGGEEDLWGRILVGLAGFGDKNAKLAAAKKALASGPLPDSHRRIVLKAIADHPEMRDQNLEESKKSVNKTILEVHRKGRKLSPAVKNNWWQND